jgi:hypothetical protein
MGILLEGFTLFIFASRFLTVMVIISGCIWVVVYVFELPFGHYVSSRAMVVGYSPSRGLKL